MSEGSHGEVTREEQNIAGRIRSNIPYLIIISAYFGVLYLLMLIIPVASRYGILMSVSGPIVVSFGIAFLVTLGFLARRDFGSITGRDALRLSGLIFASVFIYLGIWLITGYAHWTSPPEYPLRSFGYAFLVVSAFVFISVFKSKMMRAIRSR